MDYPVAFEPDLGLTAADFVAAWNDFPTCTERAKARCDEAVSIYADLGLALDGVAILNGAVGSITAAILYDLAKAALARRGINTPKSTEVVDIKCPDGSSIFVFKRVE
ncbi:MAG: hypothetical protein HY675_24670 [Chloroflexi bacterium]|nr:hypothetical protein [Chloroflexota bacterium]